MLELAESIFSPIIKAHKSKKVRSLENISVQSLPISKLLESLESRMKMYLDSGIGSVEDIVSVLLLVFYHFILFMDTIKSSHSSMD